MSRKQLLSIFVSLAIAAALFTAPKGIAFAAQHFLQPEVTCSGSGCDGKLPDVSGCAGNSYAVSGGFAYISFYAAAGSPHIQETAQIQLFYSRTCSTNWSRLTITGVRGNITYVPGVERNSDNRAYLTSDEVLAAEAAGATVLDSYMVYAPTAPTTACGFIEQGGSTDLMQGTCTQYI